MFRVVAHTHVHTHVIAWAFLVRCINCEVGALIASYVGDIFGQWVTCVIKQNPEIIKVLILSTQICDEKLVNEKNAVQFNRNNLF